MTLRHGNRIRHGGGEQLVRELLATEAGEVFIGGTTEDETRQRADEIYLLRRPHGRVVHRRRGEGPVGGSA